MPKRPFIRKQKRKRHGTAFWNHEYKEGGTLRLSEAESEDLAKFLRWRSRQKDTLELNSDSSVLDVGCGNGRNLLYVHSLYNTKGIGYDNAQEAIKEAKRLSKNTPLQYETRSIEGPLPLPDESQTLALDMMASHFLNREARTILRDEIHRVLVPGGFLFMKTFLRDDDLHTERLLKERPGSEEGSYIHPVIGKEEHAYLEEELIEFLGQKFRIQKIYRSHKHKLRGKARKRRTIAVYAQKDY